MKTKKSGRGFNHLMEKEYLNPENETTIVSESSAIGYYDDSFDNPGSSYLWFGEKHHLDREQVEKVVEALNNWLENKRLEL